MKTRQALRDLRLVFEKFGYIELQQLSNDLEVLSNLRFAIEKVNLLKTRRELRRLERETS